MASVDLVEGWFRGALKPEPLLSVSQWADEHRVLSRKASSEAGKWRTDRTPYLREIMDSLSPMHPSKKVVFKKASQIGGTECGNNWLGFIIDHAPGPTMLVLPTVDVAKKNSHLRIEPLVDETPRVKAKMSRHRSRDKTNTVLQKDFDGGTLIMTGANSASGLKSVPCRYLMLDEIDEYPRNVEGQGDPIALAMARSRTFSRRKAFLLSTPTYQGASKIDSEYENSDQRQYFVPCPHCGEKQVLEFKNLLWTEGEPKSVMYYCHACGAGIEERYKTKMLEQGEWRALNPGHEVAGFFLNSLYSPIGWLSWAEIASDYEKAKDQMLKEKNDELLVTFTNTILGESYALAGDAPEWKRLYLRRETYAIGECPDGVLFLTCGADVQKDRIECEVVGWGENKESWSIAYQVFMGDTSASEVWKTFEDYITQTFTHASGEQLPIKLTAVDSGFNTQHVYNFCRKFPLNRVVPVKGNDNLAIAVGLPRITDAKMKNRAIRRAVKVWNVGVSILKAELYGLLKLEEPVGEETHPSGFCHFPEYDEEYFKQLTAEKVIIRRNRKGYSATEWVKDRERNEALDCRIYARAAASMVGIDRFKQKDYEKFRVQLVAKPAERVETSEETQISGPPKTRKERTKIKRESAIW